jgi:hypothetical protein
MSSAEYPISVCDIDNGFLISKFLYDLTTRTARGAAIIRYYGEGPDMRGAFRNSFEDSNPFSTQG